MSAISPTADIGIGVTSTSRASWFRYCLLVFSTGKTFSSSSGRGRPVRTENLNPDVMVICRVTTGGQGTDSSDRRFRSILVAMMKSFSCSPLIFLVLKETVA